MIGRSIDKKSGPLSEKVNTLGIDTLADLLKWLQKLPYGRNTNRSDFTLVPDEERGTCSTKNALVKAIAQENGWSQIQLYVGFFFMSPDLFPKLKPLFENTSLRGIPEAHTFLVIDDRYTDTTGLSGKIEPGMIVDEIEIQPEGIGHLKESIHKGYLIEWAEDEKINLPQDQLWALREACIKIFTED